MRRFLTENNAKKRRSKCRKDAQSSGRERERESGELPELRERRSTHSLNKTTLSDRKRVARRQQKKVTLIG